MIRYGLGKPKQNNMKEELEVRVLFSCRPLSEGWPHCGQSVHAPPLATSVDLTLAQVHDVMFLIQDVLSLPVQESCWLYGVQI